MNKFKEYYDLGFVKNKRLLTTDEVSEYKKLSIQDRPENIVKGLDVDTYFEILEITPKEELEDLYYYLKFKNEKEKTSTLIYARKFFKLSYYLLITGIVIYLVFLIYILSNLG